jgi:hypothetical protein
VEITTQQDFRGLEAHKIDGTISFWLPARFIIGTPVKIISYLGLPLLVFPWYLWVCGLVVFFWRYLICSKV